MSFEVILPLLRPISEYILDADTSEIMINGETHTVFIQRNGKHQQLDIVLDDRKVTRAAKNLAMLLQKRLDENNQVLHGRFQDGSRVTASIPPMSVGGCTMNIRKFQPQFFTASELVRVGTLPTAALDVLLSAVRDRKNIMVSGATGSGKTTLINMLCQSISLEERLGIIETTRELSVPHRNVFRYEETPGVTIRKGLETALRNQPDRIIIGEVRSDEAKDLLDSLNTGHEGAITSIHANSARDAVERFMDLITPTTTLPHAAICRRVARGLHLNVHMRRMQDGSRKLTEIAGIKAYDQTHDRFDFQEYYKL